MGGMRATWVTGCSVGYGPNKTGRNIYGKTPARRCSGSLSSSTDGTTDLVATDERETSGDGPFREADLIIRRELRRWARRAGLVRERRLRLVTLPAETGPKIALALDAGDPRGGQWKREGEVFDRA